MYPHPAISAEVGRQRRAGLITTADSDSRPRSPKSPAPHTSRMPRQHRAQILVFPYSAGKQQDSHAPAIGLEPITCRLTEGLSHARQIVNAICARRAEIILTPAGQVISRVAGLFPGLTSQLLHLVQQLVLQELARRGGAAGTPGHDLDPALPRKAFDRLTAWGQSRVVAAWLRLWIALVSGGQQAAGERQRGTGHDSGHLPGEP